MPLNPSPSWPVSLDSLPDPTDTTYTDDDGYELDLLLKKHNAILEALETKLGPGSTTPARGKMLVSPGGGNSQWDSVARKNLITNGTFAVWQRGTSAPTASDNAYGPDRWRLLLEAANAASIDKDTSDFPSDGANQSCKLTVGSGEDNKFGVWTVLEGKNCRHLRGKKVSLQAKLKATAAITDARIAVVEFTGSEDSVSGDPISSWGSAGTPPTLAANYAYLGGSTTNQSPTTSWATYRVEGITVGASMTNLAVMVWCEDESTTVTTDIMRIADVQLEEGEICTEVERLDFSDELRRCQRYYAKTFAQATKPAQNAGDTGALGYFVYASGAVTASVNWRFPVTMRSTSPTMTFYSTGSATAKWRNHSDGADSGDASSQSLGDSGVTVQNPQVAGDGVGERLSLHATADAEL